MLFRVFPVFRVFTSEIGPKTPKTFNQIQLLTKTVLSTFGSNKLCVCVFNQVYDEQLKIAIQLASNTSPSTAEKTKMESLEKARNDLTKHHNYVISMSLKSSEKSRKSLDEEPEEQNKLAEREKDTRPDVEETRKQNNQNGMYDFILQYMMSCCAPSMVLVPIGERILID